MLAFGNRWAWGLMQRHAWCRCGSVLAASGLLKGWLFPPGCSYEEFAVRSFVDDQRQIVWCPAPGELGCMTLRCRSHGA